MIDRRGAPHPGNWVWGAPDFYTEIIVNKTLKRALICGLVLVCLGMTSIARAQILIEEGKIKKIVEPGQTMVGTLLVHNTSSEPFRIRAYWQDFKYTEPFDGKKDFIAPGTVTLGMSEWINFSPPEFSLPAYGKQKITYTIKVPSSTRGGHYGVLFFEKGALDKKNQSGVRVVTRVGCLFFMEAKSRSKAGKVEDLSLNNKSLKGFFHNTGDVIELPQGIYYIMDKEGMVVDRGELNRFYLPPGARTDFAIKFPDNLGSGKYTIVLTFDLEEGDTLVKEADLDKDDQGAVHLLQERD